MSFLLYASLVLSTVAIDVTIPSSYSGNSSAPLDPTPVGASIEFFAWPGYNDIPGTYGCLGQLASLTGRYPPIRIGGTTQDRALFDPDLSAPVEYYVANYTVAPLNLTYGPSFIGLAAQWPGNMTMGLNRELANLSNTIEAANLSIQEIANLYAIELGNEPDLYSSSSPIAGNQTWTVQRDAESQVSWQTSIAHALNVTKSSFQAGVRLEPTQGWTITQLIPYEISSKAISFVRSFGEHSYPQSACSGSTTNLTELQSHSSIVNYTSAFAPEIRASIQVGKPHIFSETNSATCGGGGISSTFGAALWIVDYTLQALVLGSRQLLFHQGTIGNCAYCWWGSNVTYAPFYGAYFVTEALSGGAKYVEMLDDGEGDVGIYATWKDVNVLDKVLIYNSQYYDSNATTTARPSQNVTLKVAGSGQGQQSLKALRLTAQSATSMVESGQNPSIGGLMFANATCAKEGQLNYEKVPITDDGQQQQGTVTVAASEALLVYFT